MKLSYCLIILLLSTTILSCKKDKIVSSKQEDCDCSCSPLDFKLNGMIYDYYKTDTQYRLPCFNPNNANEFVYYYVNRDAGVRQIIKYNIQTKHKTILVGGMEIYGQPVWNKMGWIAFVRKLNSVIDNIFIIKDTGDSLTQFTNSPPNLFLTWDYEGNSLFWVYSPILANTYYVLHKNIYSNSGPDTLSYNKVYDISVNYKNRYFTTKYNDVGYYTLSDSDKFKSFTSLLNFKEGGIEGLAVSNDGNYIYITRLNKGLYRINVNTKQKVKLLDFCSSFHYKTISYSPNGKYLIGERVDSRLETNENDKQTGKILEKRSVWLINLETLEQTKINLK